MAQYKIGDKFECEYISFVMIEQKSKTSVWRCYNNRSGNILGIVKWYAKWRQYCYLSSPNIVYSKGCLKDIGDFIQKLKNGNRGQSGARGE